MKAKRMNTNAIKGNKMAGRKYNVWGQRIHVETDTRKKTTTQEKKRRDVRTSSIYCSGEGCKSKSVKNPVEKSGDECKVCYSEVFNNMRIGRAKNDIRLPMDYNIGARVVQ